MKQPVREDGDGGIVDDDGGVGGCRSRGVDGVAVGDIERQGHDSAVIPSPRVACGGIDLLRPTIQRLLDELDS